MGPGSVLRTVRDDSRAKGQMMADKRWLPETLFDDLGFRMTFAVDKVLYEQQTSTSTSCCSSRSISARC